MFLFPAMRHCTFEEQVQSFTGLERSLFCGPAQFLFPTPKQLYLRLPLQQVSCSLPGNSISTVGSKCYTTSRVWLFLVRRKYTLAKNRMFPLLGFFSDPRRKLHQPRDIFKMRAKYLSNGIMKLFLSDYRLTKGLSADVSCLLGSQSSTISSIYPYLFISNKLCLPRPASGKSVSLFCSCFWLLRIPGQNVHVYVLLAFPFLLPFAMLAIKLCFTR